MGHISEAQMEFVNVRCPLHDEQAATEFLFEVPPNNWAQGVSLRVVRCKECGLVFFNPNISIKDRKDYHTEAYYIANEKGCVGYPNYLEKDHIGAKIYFGKLLHSWFSRLWKDKQRKPMSLIDLGCATGHMSKPFHDKGWKVVGIDFSEWAITWGRENLGMDLRCQDMDELLLDEEEKFDCVLFWDSLEHSQYPRKLLKKVYEYTASEMLMIIQMPDVDKFVDNPQDSFWSLYQHCFHYNEKTLAKLLELEGFKISKKLPSSQPREMLFVAEKRKD